MTIIQNNALNENNVLKTAAINASKELGITQQNLAKMVGRSRITIAQSGIDPESKPGELALLVIRVYRGLYAILGGDRTNMRIWMSSHNAYLGGVPVTCMEDPVGLVHTVEYLDAMRGKI